jgi:hypothetical protein
MNNTVFVSLSRIAKKNGRSTIKSIGGGGALVTPIPILVAAAATVPSSLTSTTALWSTLPMIF